MLSFIVTNKTDNIDDEMYYYYQYGDRKSKNPDVGCNKNNSWEHWEKVKKLCNDSESLFIGGSIVSILIEFKHIVDLFTSSFRRFNEYPLYNIHCDYYQ